MDDAKRDNALALFKPKKRRSNRAYNWLIMGSFFGLAATQQERKRRKRGRGRGRGRRRDTYQIPLDLMIEILIRLPPKSLTRFKCVSKQWSSLISCRYFCDRLFTVTRQRQQQQPRLYMSLVDEDGQRLLLSISSTSPDNTSFVVVDQDLSIPGTGGFNLNIGGLMCFSHRKKARIYNPSTKQLLTLPKIRSDIIAEQGQNKHSRYYIGHDPVSNQYKVFCTTAIYSGFLSNLKSEHWVFILEAGGSWKKVVPLENYCPHAPLSLGWYTSGSVVHYMAWFNMYSCAVVSFDIRSEELTIIPVPRDVGGDVIAPAIMMKGDLIGYGGKIAIFDHGDLKVKGLADLWVMEDVGKNEWLKESLVLQPCQRHLVHDIELIVKGTTQDGKVILAPLEMRSQFYVLCYDMQNNDLRRIEIRGVPHLWFDKECYFDLKFMDESVSFVYLET